jgi:hypothetical protein
MVFISTASLDMGATHYLKKKDEIASELRLAAGKKAKCKTFVIALGKLPRGLGHTAWNRIWHLSVRLKMCCICANFKTPAARFDRLEWP